MAAHAIDDLFDHFPDGRRAVKENLLGRDSTHPREGAAVDVATGMFDDDFRGVLPSTSESLAKLLRELVFEPTGARVWRSTGGAARDASSAELEQAIEKGAAAQAEQLQLTTAAAAGGSEPSVSVAAFVDLYRFITDMQNVRRFAATLHQREEEIEKAMLAYERAEVDSYTSEEAMTDLRRKLGWARQLDVGRRAGDEDSPLEVERVRRLKRRMVACIVRLLFDMSANLRFDLGEGRPGLQKDYADLCDRRTKLVEARKALEDRKAQEATLPPPATTAAETSAASPPEAETTAVPLLQPSPPPPRLAATDEAMAAAEAAAEGPGDDLKTSPLGFSGATPGGNPAPELRQRAVGGANAAFGALAGFVNKGASAIVPKKDALDAIDRRWVVSTKGMDRYHTCCRVLSCVSELVKDPQLAEAEREAAANAMAARGTNPSTAGAATHGHGVHLFQDADVTGAKLQTTDALGAVNAAAARLVRLLDLDPSTDPSGEEVYKAALELGDRRGVIPEAWRGNEAGDLGATADGGATGSPGGQVGKDYYAPGWWDDLAARALPPETAEAGLVSAVRAAVMDRREARRRRAEAYVKFLTTAARLKLFTINYYLLRQKVQADNEALFGEVDKREKALRDARDQMIRKGVEEAKKEKDRLDKERKRVQAEKEKKEKKEKEEEEKKKKLAAAQAENTTNTEEEEIKKGAGVVGGGPRVFLGGLLGGAKGDTMSSQQQNSAPGGGSGGQEQPSELRLPSAADAAGDQVPPSGPALATTTTTTAAADDLQAVVVHATGK